ncbi:hypothetical protein [Citrobacter braakii]|uniref:hypothetical protein n=1 Tax=Citrobacter braakii TaxID=57706 RepID=UPI0032C108F4
MTKLTKEQLIEDLKASTQNASGMFEIGEETICELVALLTEPSAPVSVPDLKPVGFLFVSDDGAVAYSPAGLPMKGFNLIGPIYGDVNACRAAMLQAGNSPVTPDCWCRICRPVTMSDMRFVVCPDCGNKRCPRANDHRNDCTGSNEPGQAGSVCPAAPQQEVTSARVHPARNK